MTRLLILLDINNDRVTTGQIGEHDFKTIASCTIGIYEQLHCIITVNNKKYILSYAVGV